MAVERLANSTSTEDNFLSQYGGSRSDTATLIDNSAVQGSSNVDRQDLVARQKLQCGCLVEDPTGADVDKCLCWQIEEPLSRIGDPSGNVDLSKKAEAAWARCSSSLKTHNENVVKAWNEEIDALLVFAGLFSAVLTAFNVAILPEISADEPPDSSIAAIWINTLWFFSLVFSLAGASVGIVVRQWLRQFVTPTPYDPKCSACIHYLRWDLGVIPWHLPLILDILPVCLQLAVILFLVGLVGLLWTLNNVVAGIISTIVAMLFILAIYTTLLPIWEPYCPYKSLQALMACYIAEWLCSNSASRAVYRIYCACLRTVKVKRDHNTDTRRFPVHRRTGSSEKRFLNWLEQERAIVTASPQSPLGNLMNDVKKHVLPRAHELLMDDSFVEEVIHPCLLEPFRDDQDVTIALGYIDDMIGGDKVVSSIARASVGDIAIDLSTKIPSDKLASFIATCGPHIADYSEAKNNIRALVQFSKAVSRISGDWHDIQELQIEHAIVLRETTTSLVDFFGRIFNDLSEPKVFRDIFESNLAIDHSYIHFLLVYALEYSASQLSDSSNPANQPPNIVPSHQADTPRQSADGWPPFWPFGVHSPIHDVVDPGTQWLQEEKQADTQQHAISAYRLSVFLASCVPTACLAQHLSTKLEELWKRLDDVNKWRQNGRHGSIREDRAPTGEKQLQAIRESVCTRLDVYNKIMNFDDPQHSLDDARQRQAMMLQQLEEKEEDNLSTEIRATLIQQIFDNGPKTYGPFLPLTATNPPLHPAASADTQ